MGLTFVWFLFWFAHTRGEVESKDNYRHLYIHFPPFTLSEKKKQRTDLANKEVARFAFVQLGTAVNKIFRFLLLQLKAEISIHQLPISTGSPVHLRKSLR